MSALKAIQAVRSGRIDATRVRAVVRKEITDYRRNRFVLGTMTVLPIVFLVNPIINIFAGPTGGIDHTALQARVGSTMLFLLLVPVILPATIAATSIVTEREQGTLEPVLTTPVRSEELLIGKALAALIPAVSIAYAMLGIFLLAVKLFAHQQIADAVLEGPRILAPGTCSSRCSPAGRSGPGWRCRCAPTTCASRSSWGRWRACRRWRSRR